VIHGTTGDGKLDTVIVNGSDGKNTIDVAWSDRLHRPGLRPR
jgi:hypothetical protein